MPGDQPIPPVEPSRPSLIQHAPSGLRPSPDGPAVPVPVAPVAAGVPAVAPSAPGTPATLHPKIKSFAQGLAGGRHEDNWVRSPNVTGTGAIHVKSFHAKLTGDSLEFLDQQINEWLDSHPQYEVKFITSAVGEWTGKLKEPNLIVMVWV